MPGAKETPICTADLVDKHKDRVRSCLLQFHDFGGSKAFFGRIRTIACIEDNALVRSLFSEPGEGCVLVVDGGGSLKSALIGDVLAELGRSSGWAGAVVNGAVRDIVALGTLSFGVKALGSNPMTSSKTAAGGTDVPVVFGGVLFGPGEWIYCDPDGVLVSENSLAL
ncbi:MAG: ribonuclease E activity regulator RraA [Kiloniellales bacterium]